MRHNEIIMGIINQKLTMDYNQAIKTRYKPIIFHSNLIPKITLHKNYKQPKIL